ncbi:hypothetical protein [Pseudonocardia sp. McavD-2-B]|uniref:hypothetical protein n=1 Tax=Pseudonocardia sp. McavD-2-B TaxID=2954499 RepID=UPI0020975F03|nr:hypothetical protein [Pseudonocardia sp. McavD-2-B]MCO7192813.1 hypothetical protein [Pseudonocardia sp. McavD-2-B]
MQQCVPDEGGMPAEQPQRAVDRRARIEQAVGWSAQQHDLPGAGARAAARGGGPPWRGCRRLADAVLRRDDVLGPS